MGSVELQYSSISHNNRYYYTEQADTGNTKQKYYALTFTANVSNKNDNPLQLYKLTTESISCPVVVSSNFKSRQRDVLKCNRISYLFFHFRNTLSRFPLRCLSKYHKQACIRITATSKSRVGRQHENAIREV